MRGLELTIGLAAFGVALPLSLLYLATLNALLNAAKRTGIDLGSLFLRPNPIGVFRALFTNQYTALGDADITRFTRSARILLGLAGLAMLVALACLELADA